MNNQIKTLIKLKAEFNNAFNNTASTSESRKDYAIIISLLDLCILQAQIAAKREQK